MLNSEVNGSIFTSFIIKSGELSDNGVKSSGQKRGLD